MKRTTLLFAIFIMSQPLLFGVEITIPKKDATVWAQEQVIIGEVDTATATEGLLLDPTPPGPKASARTRER